MAEVLTTYTETDPNNRYAVTATQVTVTNASRNEDAWVVDDKGAAFFSNNFIHRLSVQINSTTTAGSFGYPWAIANIVDDMNAIFTTSDALNIALQNLGGSFRIVLQEFDGGASVFDVFVGSSDTEYWLEVERDESIGSFGVLICRIYSDAYITPVETLTVTLGQFLDARYIYAFNLFNDGTVADFDGFMRNLELNGEEPPSIGSRNLLLLIKHKRDFKRRIK